MTLDCSLEAQDQRRRLLKELIDKRYSGVQSVSDRSRSVSYQDPTTLNRLIRSLRDELAYCDGTYQRPRRFVYLPYDKWR
jgi:hypothetical protein